MSLNGRNLYRFGEFSFNAEENILRRGDKILPLTPKILDLLQVFVENQGRLLEKNDLMDQVWPDSFVEESNLAVAIRQLRKALGDDAHHPLYIETVARRGYRFIADVEKTAAGDGSGEIRPAAARSRYGRFIPIAAVAGLLIASITLGSFYLQNNRSEGAPILSTPFESEKLSANGRVYSAVLSPDGESVVYTVFAGGKEGVWLRQLESGNIVEIIPASDNDYHNFSFSPDGSFLYFTRSPFNAVGEPADIYRVSIFGGIPAKVVSNTNVSISISPDGSMISFVRCRHADDEFCSLWIADSADGKNERILASRPRRFRIAANKFAPDGTSVAFAVGQSENAANEFGLMEVDLKSGVERELTPEKFFNIRHLEWLPDGSGLLITASRIATRNFRIWRVSALTGEAIPLTKDSESYSALSLDKEGTRLITTRVTNDFRLVHSNIEHPAERQVLVDSVGSAAFAQDGGIIFQTEMTGNMEIWSMNPDGSQQRQLTNDPADDIRPVVSADSGFVFFCSNRSGQMQVWRMNPDGSDQMQITTKNGGMPLFAHGEWIYYLHGIDRTLWRVSAKTRAEALILDKRSDGVGFAFSPDGSHVAFSDRKAEESRIAIFSLAEGRTIRTLALADGKARLWEFAWLANGRSIGYIQDDLKDGNITLWQQSIDGGPPEKMADLGVEQTLSLRFAPDGKAFAFVQGSWKQDAVLLRGLR